MQSKLSLKASLESQVESKLRLEASLKGQVESKLRWEANLKGQVGSKLRLEGTRTAFKCVLDGQRGSKLSSKDVQEAPKRLQVGFQRRPREVQELRNSSPSAIGQQTAPPCKNNGFPKENL